MTIELLDISISRPRKAKPPASQKRLADGRMEFSFPNGLRVRREPTKCLGCGKEEAHHGMNAASGMLLALGKCQSCFDLEKENWLAAKKRERQLRASRPGDNAGERRRIAQILAAPIWRDRPKISKIYAQAKQLTEETGVSHHVDHIYPIQSEYGCGLHVHHNLQILPSRENIIKGNTFPLFDSPALRL